MKFTRRTFVGTGRQALPLPPCFPVKVWAQAKKPASPVTITIADVAGNLALTQGMFEAYIRKVRTGFRSSHSPKRRPPSFPARSRRSRRPARSISIWC